MAPIPLLPAVLLLALAAQPAAAKPAFFGVLTASYPAPAVAARACQNCHTASGPPALNPYGLSLQAAVPADRVVTADLLRAADAADADGDGVSNGDELRAATAPGAPEASRGPTVAAAATTGADQPVAPGVTPPTVEVANSIPRHGMHPLVVHFPIALFISGLALDLLGLMKQHRGLLFAGWCNLLMAALGTLGSMLTGAAALNLSKIPFDGLIRTHAMLAMGGALVLFLLVGMRVHRHERLNPGQRVVYYLLAATGLGLIASAAHLGGSYVYGE